MTRGEQQQQEGLNGQSKGGAEAEKSLMQLRQRSYQICWSQWEIECFFFCHLDGGRHGSAMSCASCCQQRSNTVWMREGNPQNKENRINGKQKKSQISIHPGGRDNPSTPQPAQGDWDCFGPLLWLMRRGEKSKRALLGFSYAIFDSYSYWRWFLAGCSGNRSLLPFTLTTPLTSWSLLLYRVVLLSDAESHQDLRKKETERGKENENKLLVLSSGIQRAALENSAGLHFCPRFGKVSIILPFLNFVSFS